VWNELHGRYEVKRINYQEAYSLNGACTNQAESYFSRLRRGVAGPYLLRYAQEAGWREDNRRVSMAIQVRSVASLALKRSIGIGGRNHSVRALKRKASVDFSGYWQRHIWQRAI
jgi:hypothetical protein